VLGWNTREPVASMKPGYALIYDNVVTEGGDTRQRRGWASHATGLGARVDGLLPWTGAGSSEKLFASAGTAIYECTSAGAVGAAAVSTLTSARWDSINFAASGGNFLFAWNGTNTERTYDGSTWATWSATGLTGRTIWAGSFKGRMFAGTSGRLSFYYGGAGAIAGAFTEFPFQGIARRGGSVVAFATLSGDNGDGPDDLAVFITSEGEAIVYAGTDPSSATTWALVGRWELPRPLGAPHRCVMRWGGDALYLSDQGVIPLSAFRSGMTTDHAMEKYALTRNIEPTWRALASERRSSSGWGMCGMARYGLVAINTPWSATAAQQIVISENGAVSRWAGAPAAVWCEALGGGIYFGDITSAGRVMRYGESNSDAGSGVRFEAMTAFNALRGPGRWKQATQAQPILRDAQGSEFSVAALPDWTVPTAQMVALGATATAPALPAYVGGSAIGVFDVGTFDVSIFGGGEGGVTMPWRGATGIGQAFALRMRGIGGNGRPAWLGSNLVYQTGGPTR
jgi:hypothetical protein